jgi:cytidine deaminase
MEENKIAVIKKTMIEKAKAAADFARPHLSHYRVGAAIGASDGQIYTGCNIEFDNYSNTIHAEEAALSNMASSSQDAKPIIIAVYTSGEDVAWPCGMCRQSLFEMGGNNLRVIACNDSSYEIMSIAELLPKAFKL